MDGLSDPRDDSKWSAGDLITVGFVNTPELVALLEDTRELAEVHLDAYDALLVAGGRAPDVQLPRLQASPRCHPPFLRV
jgi:putative intracellular protease/amidase